MTVVQEVAMDGQATTPTPAVTPSTTRAEINPLIGGCFDFGNGRKLRIVRVEGGSLWVEVA